MNNRRATIKDVARQAGVSVGTVSAVLNGHDKVREPTRSKVLTAIRKLDYAPSQVARNLRLREPHVPHAGRCIGMLVKEIDNPFYAEVILGAREVLKEHGYSLFLTSSEGKYEDEEAMINALRVSGMEALLIAPITDEQANFTHLFALQRESFPFVLLGEVKGLPVSMVTSDNEKAAQMAAAHLLASGHSRIGHFAGPAYSSQSRYRIAGFRRAFSESNLIFQDAFIIPAGDHLADGYRAALAYFSDSAPDERPTAVTCFNDLVAMGLMRALADLGIHVPGDVSVIGYDDIEIGRYQATPLSTVRTSTRRMGRLAAELLLKGLQASGASRAEHVYVEAELVLRSSSRSLTDGD